MPIRPHWLADLQPLPFLNDDEPLARLAGSEMTLWVVFLTATTLLFLCFRFGQHLRRQWIAERLRAFAEAQILPPEILQEGRAATLEIPTNEGMRRGTSLVRAIRSQLIALSLPEDGTGAWLSVGTPLRVTVAGETAAFRFHASVVDRRVVEGVPTVYIGRPDWVEKVQRRQFFRIAVNLPTLVTPILETEETPSLYRGTIDNLSGGGFRILLPTSLEEGARIRVHLPIATLQHASFEARILRCSPHHPVGPMRYRAQCEFIELNETTREMIVQFCFEVQREGIQERASREA